MAFEWKAEFSVGIGEIDIQHRKIIEKINEVLNASETGSGRETIVEFIESLAVYVSEHFSAEEIIMTASNYPKINEHAAMHREFAEQVKKLRQDVISGKSGGKELEEKIKMIYRWFEKHIPEIDGAMGEYIKTKIRK